MVTFPDKGSEKLTCQSHKAHITHVLNTVSNLGPATLKTTHRLLLESESEGRLDLLAWSGSWGSASESCDAQEVCEGQRVDLEVFQTQVRSSSECRDVLLRLRVREARPCLLLCTWGFVLEWKLTSPSPVSQE